MSDNEYQRPINDEESAILPVLRRRALLQTHDKIFLTVLFLILLCGVIIGLYLLATEGHEWKTPIVYNLTSRELWQAHVPSSTMRKLKLPARKIVFFHTDSSTCSNKFQCVHLLQELQLKHMFKWNEPDIFYNFVVSGDGSIFEGRGWNFQSSFPDYSFNNSITLAFVGKFDIHSPNLQQVESAKIFVDTAIKEEKLEHCFNIFVGRENRGFIDIARNIQENLSDCRGIT
ncbi:unnamed protein product [Tenebrio molitor]|nr:unnamed protein product [Tenebrio molitor]